MPKKKIAVIATGGTIGSRSYHYDLKNRIQLADDQLVVLCGPLARAALEENDVEIVTCQPLNLLSEDFSPDEWCVLAESVNQLENVDAAVILHGTDTMCYSAAALAFMLTQIDFPVVLTGSSQPPNHADSDADKNVADSILAALQLPDGVFTVFANDDNVSFVHDATAVRKFYRDGQLFHSVNRPPAAEIKDGQFKANHFRSHSPVKAKIAVENSVVMLQLYPGIDLESFFEMISRQQAKGVVISLYPAMTGPGTPPKSSLELFLKKCDQAKITVVLTLPTLREGMNMNNFYDSTLAMHNSNAIFLPTLPETAYVKTVWALAQGRKSRKLLQQDICGEFEKITS